MLSVQAIQVTLMILSLIIHIVSIIVDTARLLNLVYFGALSLSNLISFGISFRDD